MSNSYTATGTRLPFAIEVIGFSEEEGVRYQTAYLGSRVVAGSFKEADLERRDDEGISMAEAIRSFGGQPTRLKWAQFDPDRLLGYLEAHIEQGPVLEEKNLPVGIVEAIAGQSRYRFIFNGLASHAGATPMQLRRDVCARRRSSYWWWSSARARPRGWWPPWAKSRWNRAPATWCPARRP